MILKQFRIVVFFTLLALGTLVFVGCASTPAEPQVIEKVETVVVEKNVETIVTQEVEKVVTQEVQVEVVVTATPEPAAADTGEPQYGGTLVIGMSQDPFQLDPIKDLGSDGNDVILGSQMLESLLGIGQDGEIVPHLAEEMPEISDDGLTYTFKLRQGVKFHDGTDFNAEAVKFNWENLIDPAYGTRQSGRIGALVKSIDVLDPYTIRISFNRIFPDFLLEMAYRTWWRINSPTAVQELGEDYGGVKGVVGTGPFKFKEWVQGSQLVLVKNEDYWQADLPYLDEIVYKPIPDPSVKLINLQAGTVDVIYNLPFQFIQPLQEDPEVEVLLHGSGINHVIFLNTTLPMFKDKRVRQALSLAIDRQSLNELLYEGIAEIPNSPFPSWHWAHPADLPPLEYNPDKARELLKEAGYDENNPLQFEFRTDNRTLYVDEVTLVQSMWAEVGVQAEILPLDKAAFWDAILGTKEPEKYGKFQAGLGDYLGGFPEQTSYVQFQYQSNGALNTTSYNQEGGFQNPETDQLIEAATSTVDQAEAKKFYEQISQILREDMPQIQTLWLPNVNAANTRVHDFQIASQNYLPLKYVWVEPGP